jgi:hypothetical protein
MAEETIPLELPKREAKALAGMVHRLNLNDVAKFSNRTKYNDGPCEPAPHEEKMKFQVGRFTCELALDDKGEVQAQWLPWQPKYLNKDERVQYRVARAAFLERANPGSIVDVVDRLSGTDPPSRGYT